MNMGLRGLVFRFCSNGWLSCSFLHEELIEIETLTCCITYGFPCLWLSLKSGAFWLYLNGIGQISYKDRSLLYRRFCGAEDVTSRHMQSNWGAVTIKNNRS